MFSARAFQHLGGGRKGLFLLLRYMFIIAASYLLLFQESAGRPPSATVGLMIAAALGSNVLFSIIPTRYVFSWYFEAPVLVSDTLWVSWALHNTGAAGQEFFLLYFFVLFFAMLGENFGLLILGSTLVSTASVYFEPASFMWSPGPILRIVFFYMVALFYGHVLGRVRHERARAEKGLAWARELETKVAERTEELQRLFEQAQEASRLKSEFVASVSHELRTPLNIIIGYADMLLDHVAGEGDGGSMVRGIRQASGSLLEMVDSMLDLRELESGRMPVVAQRVALGPFMEAMRERERLPLAPRVELLWEIPPDLPAIETDERKLMAILDNLINNAIKFTGAGWITVSAAHVAGDRGVHFRVADTGPGIADEYLSVIFEPFHRLENAETRWRPGAGLGLAIVRRYVALLGGDVSVRSRLGIGTTFDVRVPCRLPRPEPRVAPAAAARSVVTSLDVARQGTGRLTGAAGHVATAPRRAASPTGA